MKQFVRFNHDGEVVFGQITPQGVHRISGPPFFDYQPGEKVGQLEDLELCPPVQPGKVVCVGLNYRDHAHESGADVPGEPIIFLKPTTSVIGPQDPIRYPPQSGRVDYEAELAVVIGREIFCPDPVDARRAIFGYTCANDVTARDLQRKDGQWTRAKSFNSFCPLGPVLNYDVDLADRSIEARLNGKLQQSSDVGQMLFDVDELVHFCAQVMTLYPGDVILTGTPAGVGPMHPGDVIEVSIEGFGTLSNRVISSREDPK